MIRIAARVFMLTGVAMCAYGIVEIAATQPDRALALAVGLFVGVLIVVVVSEL